jgi:hypothetical protein
MKKKLLLVAVIVALAVSAVGCITDGVGERDERVDETVATRVVIGGSKFGVKVDRVRLIIIDSLSGEMVLNRMYDTAESEIGSVPLFPASYRFVAVANEPASFTPRLDAVASPNDLAAITVPDTMVADATINPEGMLCVADQYIRIKHDYDGTPLELMLKRVFSQVKLTVFNYTRGDNITVTSVSVSALPTHSWLLRKPYTGTLTGKRIVWAGSPVMPINDPLETEGGQPVFEDVIVPEYELPTPGDQSLASKLHITADYTPDGEATIPDMEFEVIFARAPSFHLMRSNRYSVYAYFRGISPQGRSQPGEATIECIVEEEPF